MPDVVLEARTADPFEGCIGQDLLRLTMTDGTLVEGSYLTQAGMHFVHVKNGTAIGKVLGPFASEDVKSIEVVRTRDEVVGERRDRARGNRIPGRPPVTRDDYEYRLETIARAHAKAEPGRRRDEIMRQFDDVADAIQLAKSKRQWLISAGFHSLKSNAPPVLADLWFADVASPSGIQRPRPQDFDPDIAVRRRKLALPIEVTDDARSVPNVLKALRDAGLKAVVSLAGDPAWERAIVQIDLGPGRSMRFLAEARRGSSGKIEWKLSWGGNESAPGLRKRRQALKLPEYGVLKGIVTNA